MKLSKQDLEDLAMFVRMAIINEFSIKHLSGNLAKTIQVSIESEDKVQVIIPAQTYNMLQFQQRGVIIPTAHGSYASKLDEEGSSFFIYPKNSRKGSYKIYPRNHIGYIERVINNAMNMWLVMKANKYELKSRNEV